MRYAFFGLPLEKILLSVLEADALRLSEKRGTERARADNVEERTAWKIRASSYTIPMEFRCR